MAEPMITFNGNIREIGANAVKKGIVKVQIFPLTYCTTDKPSLSIEDLVGKCIFL